MVTGNPRLGPKAGDSVQFGSEYSPASGVNTRPSYVSSEHR